MRGSIGTRTVVAVAAATVLGAAVTTVPAVGRTGDLARASVASNGAGGDSGSWAPDISPDGRYVVFGSVAENLVPGNRGWVERDEVYLHDRWRHRTERVSPDRREYTADGFRLRNPAVSAGGRFVVFDSAAFDLVEGDDDIDSDVFVWDSQERTTTLVSSPPTTGQELSASWDADISSDGQVVAYTSATFEETSNWIDRAIYAYDRQAQATELVAELPDDSSDGAFFSRPVLSADGRYVAFRASSGYGTDPAASSILLHDRTTGRTEVVTELGGLPTDDPVVSGDGRFVAFASSSDELVASDDNRDVDVFVHDRLTGTTEIVSVADDGGTGEGDSVEPSISADGRRVAFHSSARLSPEDTDGSHDVYVYDRDTDRITLASADLEGDPRVDQRFYGSANASIDDAGRYVAFSTPDRPSGSRDTNRATDVYVYDLGGPSATDPPPFPGVSCPDRTSASVSCSTDSRDRLVLTGSHYDERLFGTRSADVLRGARGSDVVTGFAGPDRLYGGAGRDLLRPGSGRDVVDCGSARDRVLDARGDKVRRDCEQVRRG